MFTVFITDNAERQDADAARTHGVFATWDAAIAAAQAIVDRSLAELHRPGMRAGELFSHYTLYGEDAFIVPTAGAEKFSAWVYARVRCVLLCG
ncbi:MAG: hypothetical protein JSS44_09570 [Proteobacteria bacterium]|nr:hypothetical protein [Pseudomonadota bacterium]MBS0463323.1 hypothetical protein [Pseudomonadota bacterium]MBS0464116.1 hypothetical protein [Pseudomonadota bacterium]